jgi:hypothetical protein
MQSSFKIYTCVFAIFLSSFSTRSVTVEMTGRLKKKPNDDRHRIDRVPVFVKGKGEILGKAVSNSKGVFNLSWNDNLAKYFYFYCIQRNDTLLLAKIQKFESDTPDLTFVIPTN